MASSSEGSQEEIKITFVGDAKLGLSIVDKIIPKDKRDLNFVDSDIQKISINNTKYKNYSFQNFVAPDLIKSEYSNIFPVFSPILNPAHIICFVFSYNDEELFKKIKDFYQKFEENMKDAAIVLACYWNDPTSQEQKSNIEKSLEIYRGNKVWVDIGENEKTIYNLFDVCINSYEEKFWSTSIKYYNKERSEDVKERTEDNGKKKERIPKRKKDYRCNPY